MNFTGKCALVTGAAVGIGRAVAIKLAECGAKLVLVDINIEKLNDVKKEIQKYTNDVLVFECDITDEDYESVADGGFAEAGRRGHLCGAITGNDERGDLVA